MKKSCKCCKKDLHLPAQQPSSQPSSHFPISHLHEEPQEQVSPKDKQGHNYIDEIIIYIFSKNQSLRNCLEELIIIYNPVINEILTVRLCWSN